MAQEVARSGASWGRLGWPPLIFDAFSRLVAVEGYPCHLALLAASGLWPPASHPMAPCLVQPLNHHG